MFRLRSHPVRHSGRSLLIALALFVNLLPAPMAAAKVAPAARAVAPAQAQVESSVRVMNLTTNDMVYDKQTQKIYASVPSSAGAGGNSITEVDPASGTVGQSVFVGSEPNKLALSDDGQVLYASLDGASAVRRFDIPTHTAGTQFTLASGNSLDPPFQAADLAVAPGSRDILAVARTRPFTTPPGLGVAIFDDGVQRPNAAPGHDAPLFIAFSASASTLYGCTRSNGAMQTLTVGASGSSSAGTTPFVVEGDLQFDNGLVYNSTGKVVNPSTNTLLGTFPNVGGSTSFPTPFVVDASVGRAFYVIGNSALSNHALTLRAYDLNTFAAVGEMTVSGVNGLATSLVRWGPNGLAFRTRGGQLFLIQTSLIPSQEPVPAPTPTPVATPAPTPTPPALSVRQIALNTNDLIYSPSQQLIYASVPSSAGAVGNSVAPINPASGAVGQSVFVGSEPKKLALSDNGQALYVGLDGATAVRRFDTAAQTAGQRFSLGASQLDGPFKAGGIAVMPGTSETVVVARSTILSQSPGGSIAIYDNGVPRSNTGGGGDSIAFSANPARFYSSNGSTSSGIFRYDISDSGINVDSFASVGNGGDIKFAGGLLYFSSGSVIDPEAGVLKGTFTNNNSSSAGVNIMTVDAALRRAYFLSMPTFTTALLRVYDLNTFLPIGQVTIPNIGFTPSPEVFQFLSLVRWGENGLAFRTTTRVILIQSSLINPGGVVPVPTPMPSPTPTPTPESPTFVRQIALPINDVVLSSATQKLYAGVASSAGQSGNSIIEVDPASGDAGQPVPLGAEPSRLAMSNDGQVLWTSFANVAAVRRFDVATKTPGLQFSVPVFPPDIEVMPGSPLTLAIATGNNAPLIYDDGVLRQGAPFTGSIRAGQIEFSSNPTTLYGYDDGSTGFSFYRMNVSGSGVNRTGEARGYLSGFNTDIEFAGGRVYSTTGRVLDPETFDSLGVFGGIESFMPSAAVTVDTSLGRAFFVLDNNTNMELRAYDLNTFLPLGKAALPFAGTPTRLVRWGANGLALRAVTDGVGRLYIIQSELVSVAPIPNSVRFMLSSVSSSESDDSVTVTVVRTGDLSAAASIDYATTDGTASERSDYTTALGTLRFAPGEAQKSFTVLITDDAFQEGVETINVTLGNPVGASLMSPSTLLITLHDDDFSQPSVNPVDDALFFVGQHYNDFLNRKPDTSGLNFWANEITSCGANAQCVRAKRVNVSAAFFLSIEFQQTGYQVFRFYKASFPASTARPRGLPRYREFLRDTQEIGRGVVVGQGNWEQQLRDNTINFARVWVQRQEFMAEFPAGMTAQQFADKLFVNSDVVPTQAERAAVIVAFGAGDTEGRAQALLAVTGTGSVYNKQYNAALVLMQYIGYLRRSPDDAPDSDLAGFDFWLGKLNSFSLPDEDVRNESVAFSRVQRAEMVRAFIESTEYRKRFAP